MFNGIAVWIALCILFTWAGSTWRKRLVGFGLLTDVVMHIILQIFIGGANEGRIAMLFGGVLFSVTMMTYRKLRGYSTVVNGQWVQHSGLFYRVKPRPDESSGRAESIS